MIGQEPPIPKRINLPEISMMNEEARLELMGILFDRQPGALSENSLSLLVPAKVKEVAKNPDNIEIRQLSNQPGEVSVLVVEKDFPDELTSAEAYERWRNDVARALKEQEGKRFKTVPEAPSSVNRLHAKFASLINAGQMSLKDRVLLVSRLKLHPTNREALTIIDFDGETGKGIGADFYLSILPTFCKKIGLRFIVGENNIKNFSFFKDKIKRFTISEIKPEFKDQFFPIDDELVTIQFLYPEDVEKYVEKK